MKRCFFPYGAVLALMLSVLLTTSCAPTNNKGPLPPVVHSNAIPTDNQDDSPENANPQEPDPDSANAMDIMDAAAPTNTPESANNSADSVYSTGTSPAEPDDDNKPRQSADHVPNNGVFYQESAEEAANKASEPEVLGRAAPAYVQFLERQSLLRAAPDLAAIVSGSSLPWNAPSTRSNSTTLRRIAPTWFHFNPLFATWQGAGSALSVLGAGPLPGQLHSLGVRGILFSSLSESGLTWNVDRNFSQRGSDLVSFTISPELGGEEAYQAMENKLRSIPLLMGGEVLPAATGLGPDFSLALRGVREYPGLYMMVDIPQELWTDLPLPRRNDSPEGQILSPAHVALLSRAGVLPPAFARDNDHNVRFSAWALSGEIVGVDGVNRRWAYRFSGSPLRPVLNWDDPSGTARRVLSAGIIQQVGLYHQALASLSMEALWGQDPAPAGKSAPTAEPALSALRDLSREARRYGAWALLRDAIPASQLPLLQSTELDFAVDTVTSPFLEYALLTGDTEPLKQSLDASLNTGVDHARLWRSSADGLGVDFGLGGLNGEAALNSFFRGADKADSNANIAWVSVLPVHGNVLYASAAGLAAAAAGLNPEEARKASQNPVHAKSIADIHLLQLVFRAMQPGLLMLSGQDISGSLFIEGGPAPSFMGWSMDDGTQVSTRHGLPANIQAYPPFSAQLGDENSFMERLRRVLSLREQSHVADGTLVARVGAAESALVALLTRLPDEGLLLCAANFSGKAYRADLAFPQDLRFEKPGTDLINNNSVTLKGKRLSLDMAPWGFRILRFPH